MAESKQDAPAATPEGAAPTTPTRAEVYRERFRQAQVIMAQVARARAAGGQPSDAEAARLVAEFHARGGQVTVCPQTDDPPLDRQDRGKPARRPSSGAG